jgi:two-component system, NtrC family, response regulator AtoC
MIRGTTSAECLTESTFRSNKAMGEKDTDLMYRILVIDDEPSVCEALAMGLSSDRFRVNMALNGNRGVELGSAERYDVLIVDLCLPDMDGIEVIRRVKIYQCDIITILITAYHTTYTFAEAMNCGVNEYFEKPFAMSSMKNAVNRWIEERGTGGDDTK